MINASQRKPVHVPSCGLTLYHCSMDFINRDDHFQTNHHLLGRNWFSLSAIGFTKRGVAVTTVVPAGILVMIVAFGPIRTSSPMTTLPIITTLHPSCTR